MPVQSAFTFNFRHFQMDLNSLNCRAACGASARGWLFRGRLVKRGRMSGGGITKRKADHIDLAATGDVGFVRTTTLLECVKLVHQALPELALADVDTSLSLFGKKLRAPLV